MGKIILAVLIVAAANYFGWNASERDCYSRQKPAADARAAGIATGSSVDHGDR